MSNCLLYLLLANRRPPSDGLRSKHERTRRIESEEPRFTAKGCECEEGKKKGIGELTCFFFPSNGSLPSSFHPSISHIPWPIAEWKKVGRKWGKTRTLISANNAGKELPRYYQKNVRRKWLLNIRENNRGKWTGKGLNFDFSWLFCPVSQFFSSSTGFLPVSPRIGRDREKVLFLHKRTRNPEKVGTVGSKFLWKMQNPWKGQIMWWKNH